MKILHYYIYLLKYKLKVVVLLLYTSIVHFGERFVLFNSLPLVKVTRVKNSTGLELT